MSEFGIETDPDKTEKLSIGNCFVMEKEVEFITDPDKNRKMFLQQKIVKFLSDTVSELGTETNPDKIEKLSM